MRNYERPRAYRGSSPDKGSTTQTSEPTDDYSLFTHERCAAPRAKIFLVTIISFAVATAVVLVVVLTRIEESTPPVTSGESDSNDIGCWLNEFCGNTSEDENCRDVIIVGGGLAGSYAAWRLASRNITRSVELYESSDRFGGRLYTRTFPNFTRPLLELGSPSFVPALDRLLNQTVHYLGLKTVSTEVPEEESLYYLRGRYLKGSELNGSDVPYTLAEDERGLNPMQLIRHALEKGRHESIVQDPLETTTTMNFPNNTKPEEDKPSLYDISLHDVLMETVSYEAYNFIRDTLPADLLMETGSAGVLWDKLNALDSVDDAARFTLVDGMQSLSETLVALFALINIQKHKVYTNHRLVSVGTTETIVRLGFLKTQTEDFETKDVQPEASVMACAKSVLLAIPPEDLLAVKWGALSTSKKLKSDLNSVQGVPATKIALLYNEPWWTNANGINWREINSGMPLGLTQALDKAVDIFNSSDNSAVLTATTGERFSKYWKDLQTGPVFEHSVPNTPLLTDSVVKRAQTHLSELFGLSQTPAPEPIAGLMQKWREPSAGYGWHVWKPGVDWREVSSNIIKPFSDQKLYVIGSAFAPGFLQHSLEGAVQSAENAVRCIIKSESSSSRNQECKFDVLENSLFSVDAP